MAEDAGAPSPFAGRGDAGFAAGLGASPRFIDDAAAPAAPTEAPRSPAEAVALQLEFAQPAFDLAGNDSDSRAVNRWRGDAAAAGRRELDVEVADESLAPAAVAGAAEDSAGKEGVELTAAEAVKAAGATVTAGFIWWLTRGGGLLTMMLMGIPAWRHMDLLPVLKRQLEDDLADGDADDEGDADEADDESGGAEEPWAAQAERDFGDLFAAGAAGAGAPRAAAAAGPTPAVRP